MWRSISSCFLSSLPEELVYAKRGLTIFLNPENRVVAYITVYVPTTVDEYARRLRPPREKRPR